MFKKLGIVIVAVLVVGAGLFVPYKAEFRIDPVTSEAYVVKKAVVGSHESGIDYNVTDQGAVTATSNRSIKDFVDAIGSTKIAIIRLRHNSGGNTTIYTLTTTEVITDNFTFIIEPGAILSDGGGAADFTIDGPFEAGNYKCFDWTGSGAVVWSISQHFNQLWCGTDDAAIQMAMSFLNGADTWYWPRGSYTQTTKITLPDGVAMIGDGGSTIINSAVSGDWAIVVGAGGDSYPHKSRLSNFKLLGDMTASAASSGTGGIKFNDTDREKIEYVWVEGFGEGGWNTAGDAATEATAAGFWITGCVGLEFDHCEARHNDVGFLIDKGVQSVNTSTYFNGCSSRINRTHAAKWTDTMTTYWDGGIIESNNGLVTFEINATVGGQNLGIANVHFEGNQRISGIAAAGSRDINVTSTNGRSLLISGCTLIAGSYGPETIIELADCRDTVLLNCFLAKAAGATDEIEINSDAINTTLIGTYLGLTNVPNDAGLGTNIFGPQLAFGDAAALGDATPSVLGKVYAKMLAGAMTNLDNGAEGQIVILEGQSGSLFSAGNGNFLLKNGDDYMRFADGSVIILRKDATSGKWVLIGHEPSVAAQSLTNIAAPVLDDRKIVYVPDAAAANITSMSGGYEGQDVFFISEHTGANTTTFVDGGNLNLAGANFVMGAGDVLHLVYKKSTNRWYEVSRSANTSN